MQTKSRILASKSSFQFNPKCFLNSEKAFFWSQPGTKNCVVADTPPPTSWQLGPCVAPSAPHHQLVPDLFSCPDQGVDPTFSKSLLLLDKSTHLKSERCFPSLLLAPSYIVQLYLALPGQMCACAARAVETGRLLSNDDPTSA